MKVTHIVFEIYLDVFAVWEILTLFFFQKWRLVKDV